MVRARVRVRTRARLGYKVTATQFIERMRYDFENVQRNL